MFESLIATLLVGLLGTTVIWRGRSRAKSTRVERWQATAALGASLTVMFFIGNAV